jgi:hypothetical protein
MLGISFEAVLKNLDIIFRNCKKFTNSAYLKPVYGALKCVGNEFKNL